MVTWLIGNPDGQRVYAIVDEHLHRKPIPLLILGSGDGWLEVYGPGAINVHYQQRLHVAGRTLGLRSEDWLDLVLPKSHKDCYWPAHMPGSNQGGLRWQGQCEALTVEQACDTAPGAVVPFWFRGVDGVFHRSE